jgi:3-hexulose-6-phosphate synthase and related proteins
MKLQVAFDLQSSNEILNFLEKNGDLIDIIEIGTPLIIKEGLKSVKKIKKRFPKQTVLADLKIMDAGLLEAQIGFDAGADIITVLGLASTETLSGVKQAAVKNEKEVMVDMINHPSPENKWNEIKNMEMSLCCLHTANDAIKDGETPLNALERFYNLNGGENIAVAGGINPNMIRKINSFRPKVVIVGGYIANSRNHRAALEEIHQAMDS